jgi:hypothetical protein
MTDTVTLQQTDYKMEKTDKLLNMAVVPDKSRALFRFNGGNPELQRAWYRGQVAKFFLFDEAPLSVSGDKVPVSPIYDGFTINPGEPNGGTQFCTDPGSNQTHNVVGTVPGDVTRLLQHRAHCVCREYRPARLAKGTPSTRMRQ